MASPVLRTDDARGRVPRSLVIVLIAFFTVVDLFATQAILPLLAHSYGVTPAAMSVAVNSSTIGMAIAGLGVALFSRHLPQRAGIVTALVLLALPTALLAHAPGLAVFALLRIVQGLCMSTAFTLTLAYLGENCSAADQAGAFAAYITGNVASNLVGRYVAANVAGHLGLASNFYLFAALNLAGAALAWVTINRASPMAQTAAMPPMSTVARLRGLASPALLASFGVGFCILFAFIGIFTFINFVLVKPPLSLGMHGVGFVYLVFLPSIFLTPQAGRIVARYGTRAALWAGLGAAAFGLPFLLSSHLVLVLAGMTLVGAGTFFAQATATGFVSRAASDRAAASGAYLAAYFTGGLAGTALLGMAYDHGGWPACVAGVGAALAAAAVLARKLVQGAATPG